MANKYTLKEVKEIFKKNGCELLEPTYRNNAQVLKYVCSCGRMGGTTLKTFIDRKNCKFCSLKKKYKSMSEKLKTKKLNEMERLFSMSDAAEIMGLSIGQFYDMVRMSKILPAPTRTSVFSVTKRREYYSEDDISEVKNKLLEIVVME